LIDNQDQRHQDITMIHW